jgi:hypothetical protein
MLWWIIGGPRCTIRCRPPVAAADDAIADLDLDQKPDRLLRVFIERTPERTIHRVAGTKIATSRQRLLNGWDLNT